MIYTSVSFERVEAICNLLVAEEIVPNWFRDVPVIRPEKTLKPKDACGREDALLLDDQRAVIVPGEEEWAILIPEFLPPYSAEDDALDGVLDDIGARARSLAKSH
ncbi:hypothetical protein KUV44_01850 [Marinobacter daepoensis]|uniref:Uncharacterized protein n=1 Tax=Marinobacter daepoensis TaxID=262077 RepID=A0ABS3BBF6_9GAMM|nr:hypothetical protein [Marinobacter daepoensis]MBN7769189.1 hypothetical protein [Marinobacter daepoensis]MBY6077879.1 hypothetical protein [Marinobacter daepoensis]